MDQVILVDTNDNELGFLEKLEAHQKGLLHRAFSVFLFNSHGELLLQKRAQEKYHSDGLWTNTCCSHPRAGESVLAAADRRLKEEMGIESEMREAFSFVYRSEMENGLIEHEYDHVLFGSFDGIPDPNPGEVSGWKYLSLDRIESELGAKPEAYTSWFRICFMQVLEHFHKTYTKKVG